MLDALKDGIGYDLTIQNTPDPEDALAAIPTLSVSELEKSNKEIPCSVNGTGYKYYFHDIFTNGIIYFDLGLKLNKVPQRLLPYIHIFGRV